MNRKSVIWASLILNQIHQDNGVMELEMLYKQWNKVLLRENQKLKATEVVKDWDLSLCRSVEWTGTVPADDIQKLMSQGRRCCHSSGPHGGSTRQQKYSCDPASGSSTRNSHHRRNRSGEDKKSTIEEKWSLFACLQCAACIAAVGTIFDFKLIIASNI